MSLTIENDITDIADDESEICNKDRILVEITIKFEAWQAFPIYTVENKNNKYKYIYHN